LSNRRRFPYGLGPLPRIIGGLIGITAVLAVILVQHEYIVQKVARGVVQVAWQTAVEAIITAAVMVEVEVEVTVVTGVTGVTKKYVCL